MGWSSVSSKKICCFQNLNRTTNCCAGFWVKELWNTILGFLLWKGYLGISWNTGSLKTSLNAVGPWTLTGLSFHPWRAYILPRPLMCLGPLVPPVQVMECYQHVDQCAIISRWSRSFLTILCTEGRWVNIHSALLSIHNVNFLVFWSNRDGKEGIYQINDHIPSIWGLVNLP